MIQSNYIGTDITGTVALSTNTLFGVGLPIRVVHDRRAHADAGHGIGQRHLGQFDRHLLLGRYRARRRQHRRQHHRRRCDRRARAAKRRWGRDSLSGQPCHDRRHSGRRGNLISGDNRPGNEGNIFLDDSTDNAVVGNLIGTDITGLARLPLLAGDVGGPGVLIAAGSADNTIGGITAAARNIISGIDGPGVDITDATTTGNVVLGNYIGTALSGTAALGNDGDGVAIESGAADNTIGGTVAGAGNVISGNTAYGVEISGTGTSGNVVDGDSIGADLTGTVAIANATGVELDAGASGNTIGSTTAGAGNTIADNTQDGVQVVGNGTTGNPIRGNSIYANGVIGIELGTSGVPSTNILGGSTSGPNDDENYPVLTIVSYTPGIGTTIAGNINTTPNTTVFVDFYTDAVEGQGGFGQGQIYVGSVTVTTTNDGNASFTYLSTSLPRNAIVSATATDPGNTSEFSLDQAEDTPPIAELVARPSPAGSPATTFNEGQTITFDGSGSYSPDGDTLSYTWDFNDGTPPVTTATPTETHAYHYDGTYVVTLTVNDGHGGIESNIDILKINKLPPSITFNPLPASLAVGTTLHLTGTIDDPTPDLETVVLNWGDGSNPTTLKLPAGSSIVFGLARLCLAASRGREHGHVERDRDRRLQPRRFARAVTDRSVIAHTDLRRRRPERIDLGHADGLSASTNGRRADPQPVHGQRRRHNHALGDHRRPRPGRLPHRDDPVGRYTRPDHPGFAPRRPGVFEHTRVREHARRLALRRVADRRDGRQQRTCSRDPPLRRPSPPWTYRR